MTEAAHDNTPSRGEAPTYVRVAPPLPVTVGEGQGRGQGAGDRGGGDPPDGAPRAGAARGAPARGPSVARLQPVTLRGVASASRYLSTGARQVISEGLADVADRWGYLRDEHWMGESDNTIQQWAGYLLALAVLIPVTAAARLAQAIVTLVVDVVAALFARMLRAVATVAVIAAVVFTWPSWHHAPPPTAQTEVITPAGAP